MNAISKDDTHVPRISGARQWLRMCFPILVWLLALVVIAIVRFYPLAGAGVKMVVTAAAVFVGCVSTIVWFSFFTRFPKVIRLSTIAACVLALATLISILRIDEVTGELMPTFAYRWTPEADQDLAQIQTVKGETQGIDLSPTPQDFPQFLGPGRDLVVPDDSYRFDWDQAPPREVWRREIGAGWSAFSAVNGYAITMEQRGEQEITVCYQILTGDPVWASPVKARHETRIGGVGPRSTPTIHEGLVYVLGGTGILRCLDGRNGQQQWKHDLLREFGVENDGAAIAWGRAASPLIVESMVVVPVGGPENGTKHSLIAYDRFTGKEIWRGGDRQIGYGSPTLATIDGRSQILIVTESAVCSHDPATGELLWEHDWPGHSASQANTSQAVPVPPNRVFLSKGYGQGAALLEMTGAEDRWTSVELWHERTVMKTKYTNVAILDGYIYGLNDVFLECVELETGQRQWKKRYDYGQILLVGATLLLLDENGALFAIEARPDEHVRLAKLQVLDAVTWNNLCLYDGYLLLRNGHRAVCYELPRRKAAAKVARQEA